MILSGSGSDGSRGLCDIHRNGGLVIAQDLMTSSFDGMPRNAHATGQVDIVCPVNEMPAKIMSYCQSPTEFREAIKTQAAEIHAGDEQTAIFRLFQTIYGIDFSLYRPSTITRRLERRVQLTRSASLRDYVDLINTNPAELEQLYRDLLVEVTRFFRDPEAFELLRSLVIRPILQHQRLEQEIRVWVPACATGEEAYSIAILLDDEATKLNRPVRFRVFATDVHQKSLESASAGVYAAEVMASMPQDIKKTYFRAHGNLYHVATHIRQAVIFAPHDVTRDPPFTNLDLISCRNMLIYLEPEVQQRVLSVFHYGLRLGGGLFLGPSETLGGLDREFETLNMHWRIYRKLRDVRLADSIRIPKTPVITRTMHPQGGVVSHYQYNPRHNPAYYSAFESLLERFVPPSMLLNENLELVHSFGDAVKFLEVPTGKPTLDILKLVHTDLKMAITAAIHRAQQDNGRFCFAGVRVRHGDQEQTIRLTVEPLRRNGETTYLLTLEEIGSQSINQLEECRYDLQNQTNDRIALLEHELTFTRESLQATVEELETSNEELQSANEELIASNEELQSTNEELHSVNEELFTVNAEHQRKIAELFEMTDDMNNLLVSTNIATLFLDAQLCIRRFTPAITAIFNLIPQDVGRPIDQFSGNLQNSEFIMDLRKVLLTRTTMEKEVLVPQGTLYLQRLSPYCKTGGEIEGVIAVFTEISSLREYTVSAHVLRSDVQAIQELLTRLPEVGKLDCRLKSIASFAQLVSQPRCIQEIDWHTIVRESIDRLAIRFPQAKELIRVNALPEGKGDRNEIAFVLNALLTNALENAIPERPLPITVHGRRISQVSTVFIEDHGYGIRQDETMQIFTPFYSSSRHEDSSHAGLSLYWAKRLIMRQGGNLLFESVPLQKSAFYFTIMQ